MEGDNVYLEAQVTPTDDNTLTVILLKRKMFNFFPLVWVAGQRRSFDESLSIRLVARLRLYRPEHPLLLSGGFGNLHPYRQVYNF